MRKYSNKLVRALVIALFLLMTLSGCAAAISVIGTLGSGAASGADYLMATPFSKTVSYDYDRVKKALLVTLCKMVIEVEVVREIDDGEKIFAKADDLEIVIELKEITPRVTRIKIKAGGEFVKRDKATAEEIVQRTTQMAKKLIT